MARAADLLEQMRRNPAADWTVADIEKLCRHHGLLFLPGRATSHIQIRHPSARMILTVPARRPIKPVYIRKLVRYIETEGAIE